MARRMNNMMAERPKNFKASITKLLRYIKPFRAFMLISIVLVILATLCTLTGPNRLSKITNIVQEGISVNYAFEENEFSTLRNDKTLEKTFNNMTLTFVYIDGVGEEVSKNGITYKADDYISIMANMMNIGTANLGDLMTNPGLNFDGTGLGLSITDGELNLWFNTEAKVNIDKIVKICLILVVIYLISYMCNVVQGIIMAGVNQKVSRNIRTDISNKINKIPLKYFDSTTYGDVLSKITNDADTIGQSLNNSITSLIGSGALFIGSTIMMFVTNWIMALAGIGATLLGFLIMALIVKRSQKYFIAQQKILGSANGLIEEAYSGHEVIKVYNAEEETSENFEKINKELYKSTWKAQFFSNLMQPIMSFIGNFGYVVVCVVGALLVNNGIIGFAVIVAFMIYIRLFTHPLAQIAQGVTGLQSTSAASGRVFDFLEQPELNDESNLTKILKNIKGNVEFKNVKFGYVENKIIINDFSAKVKAGQKVAIVGPTGAGKTTLVNLLMKFYELNDGDIIIDGISIKELKRENVHELFGMVLQDTWLFEGSVKDNIKYDKEDVTDEQIIEACKACGIHHFIKTLSNRYDTILDDNTSISAGQKQLLTIARAMVENAPMLILDEATSSVDTRTEILIQKAMDALTKNRTSFVIAHRLSTIKNADIILVMKNGDIVEQGNHDELLIKGGFYAELYNSQFEEIEQD